MNYNEIMVAQAKSQVLRELGIDKENKVIISGELTDGAYTSEYKGILKVGNTYTVRLDSGTYTAVAKDYGGAGAYIGNMAVLGSDFADMDTGESWCVCDLQGFGQFIVVDANGGNHFSLETTTTTPIDPKFLPGVCLPVVELQTMITDGATFTDAENAALNKASKDSLPFILKARADNGAFVVIAFCVSPVELNDYMYVIDFFAIHFILKHDNGIWKASME